MKLKFDLRLFDAGGAEAAQASADAQTEGLDTGIEQGAEETAQSTADRQAEYEAMLEKYADLDSKRMEQAARERVTRQMEAVREQAANEQVAIWKQEAEHIKTLYPDFDLMQEIQNPLFASLISSKNQATRLSLKAAYEACHVEEIRQMAARQAAKTAEFNMIHSIRAGAHRPKEAGGGAEAAVAPGKIDIAKLTRMERQALERRAERGERITFQEDMRL